MNRPVDPEAIRSILVIRFERLGDLILVMVLVQNLRLSFPNARITLLCKDLYADFLRNQPGLDDVIAMPKKARPKQQIAGWLRIIGALLGRSFDLVIDVSDNRRSTLLTRLTNARLRVGYSPPARSPARRSYWEKGAHNIFADSRGYAGEQRGHFVNFYLSPLEALGLPVRVPRARLLATEPDRRTVRKLLSDLKVGRYAVVHPGARTPNRRWPASNYPPVIDHLSRQGLSVIVIGEAAERPIADEIAALAHGPEKRMPVFGRDHAQNEMLRRRPDRTESSPALAPPKFIDLVGKLSLGELTALLEGCSLFVGNNTGPMHIAAGVGARIVAIYGIHSILWAPLSEDHVMVTPARPCVCVDPAICRPTDPDGSLCVRRNSVDDVLRAIDSQLAAQSMLQAFDQS